MCTHSTLSKLFQQVAAVLAAMVTISCTFQQPEPEQVVVTMVSPVNDTIVTYPVITFAFSIPLQDSTASFVFSPHPGEEASYFTSINETRDTAQLIVQGMLKGRTTYDVYTSDELTAQNGTVFRPSDQSWRFITYPREQEPNDHSEIADTVYDVICGSFSRNDDTDWFRIGIDAVKAIAVSADTGPCGLTLVDSRNRRIRSTALTITDPSEISMTDTLYIPDSLQAPFTLIVNPAFSGLASHYRINLVSL
ncbi:MAG: hypothetical protein ACOC4C_01390 [Fibrobacterota bacterium]